MTSQHPELPWSEAEAARRLAYQRSSSPYPVLRELEAASRRWDAARGPGRPAAAWPWLVGARIFRSLAEASGATATVWWHRQLSAAAEAVRLEPAAAPGWAAVADAARSLLLVQTSGWALGRCRQLAGAPGRGGSVPGSLGPGSLDLGGRDELETVLSTACWLAPGQIGQLVDECAAIFPLGEADRHSYRALALFYSGDPRGALLELTAATGPAPLLWQLIFRARLLALAGGDGAAAAIGQALTALGEVSPATDPRTLLDQAGLQLYTGNVTAARELTARMRALGPDTNTPPAHAAATELLIALMTGDETAAARSGAQVLAGLYPELAYDLRADLDLLAGRLQPDAQHGASPVLADPVRAEPVRRWRDAIEQAEARRPPPLRAGAAAALAEVDTVLTEVDALPAGTDARPAAGLPAPDLAADGPRGALRALRALISDDRRGLLGG